MSTHEPLLTPTAPVVVPVPADVATAAAIPLDRVHRFTVEQYHQMAKAGVFAHDDRVELIEGFIIDRSPIGPPHASTVNKLASKLARLVEPGWHVSVQNPVTLPTSEPQPDIAIVRGTQEDYEERHPGPDHVALLIEVAESSLEFDRRAKGFTYGRVSVPEYWIVNLVDGVIEIYRRAGGQTPFQLAEVLDRSKTLKLVLDGQERGTISVSDLLPKTKS